MKSYSPYDNIRGDVAYPTVLALSGLTDFRVTYWEPAKWVARLREEAKGGPFLLEMKMGAGHSGSTGRYTRVREAAKEVAFAVNHFETLGYDMVVRSEKKPGSTAEDDNSGPPQGPSPEF
mgnify:FL=1